MTETDVQIKRLGARGDGVAETPGGVLFVPFALPGEVWGVRRDEQDANGLKRLTSHPDRREPACRHFGVCGGCVAQHVPVELYLSWKRSIIVEALQQHGIDADVAPCIAIGTGTRRRTILTASQQNGRAVLGYFKRSAHDLVDVDMCPILVPEIVSRLEALRTLAGRLLRRGETLRLTIVAAQEGLDVAVTEVEATRVSDASTRAGLAALADASGFVRLTVAGVEIFQRAQPTLSSNGVSVPIPQGAFLQASAMAEREMAGLVVAAVADAGAVADLFSGLGAFALAIASTARVTAFDTDAVGLDALAAGLRRASGLKPIETVTRDLFREPLSRTELRAFDAVVLDPPRAGAKAQSQMLARSDVATIAAVSCNPGTFARDARILIDGGYQLDRVVPIDQFVYSEHVELVATFSRAKALRRSSNWRRRR